MWRIGLEKSCYLWREQARVKQYFLKLSLKNLFLSTSMDKTQKKVCVIGLGHIGLPTACVLATSGYQVLGVDKSRKVLDRLHRAQPINPEPDLQKLLAKVLKDGALKLSTQINSAAIYIIAVPTPLDNFNKPDISLVNSVIEALRPHLRPGNLVLLESTCPIGTTETIAKSLKITCPEIYVAYCPERVLPGNILFELIHNDRVIGGVDQTSTDLSVEFYKTFVLGDVVATNARTAEAVKLAENTFRDINIAYANELSMIAERLDIDAKELIRLANKHPRVKILSPGPGVGGHCIAVDPWFLASAAPDLARLISRARETNKKKTEWVIGKVHEAAKKSGAKVIACLGVTYKPNVCDIRESPALEIVRCLEKDFHVLSVDPYVPGTENLYDAIDRAEVVVGLVAHNEFLNISQEHLRGKIKLDFAGVFP